jgi:hypothetical protein
MIGSDRGHDHFEPSEPAHASAGELILDASGETPYTKAELVQVTCQRSFPFNMKNTIGSKCL